ncbi:DNA repair protein XRCC3 isoform X3 [Oryzias latipes]|uniref:DNA repair protein XRCC3 isoform X3 n=1 Tax=Oryzias latipes TaxID=8090 RepID=UPI000CE16DEE|nr:DNA repair protein XRCC3 isoform X3 [Oryzias latipes]
MHAVSIPEPFMIIIDVRCQRKRQPPHKATSGANLKSVREVLSLPAVDVQRLTGLAHPEVHQLLTAAAHACRRHAPLSVLQLQRGECCRCESGLRLGVSCPVLDGLLRGGLPVGGITELSGQSGAGKTQLALQISLSVQYPVEHGGLGGGALYICTEDSFPIRRLQQMISEQANLRSEVPSSLIRGLRFSDHVYIEHAADLVSLTSLSFWDHSCSLTGPPGLQDSLQVCLSRRAPVLLAAGLVRLIVVDSVAALFRSEFQAEDWMERNKQLLTFSSMLHQLSQEFTTPVLCINQVTDVLKDHDSLGPLSSSVTPALGLAWANQVLVRLMIRRLQKTVSRGDQSSALRQLEVVFAPHLARSKCEVAVWREGVRGVAAFE